MSLKSIKHLEHFANTKLSKHFYMRDFLYSTVACAYRTRNVPDYPDVALEAGKNLCTRILEPLIELCGPITLGSGYRSPEVNKICNENNLNCASNERNYARHIWDYPDKDGRIGAMVIVEVINYREDYERTGDFRPLARHIHTSGIPYNQMVFFPKHCRFNIGWKSGRPEKKILSYISPWRGGFDPNAK